MMRLMMVIATTFAFSRDPWRLLHQFLILFIWGVCLVLFLVWLVSLRH